jgi:hypothetical protein
MVKKSKLLVWQEVYSSLFPPQIKNPGVVSTGLNKKAKV